MKQIFWLSIILIIIALSVWALTLIKKDRQRIFNNKQQQISIVCGGDVMLGRSVNVKMIQNSSLWPFEKISSLLKSADISFINLESPFAQPCPTTNTGMIFCTDNKNIEGLVSSGINIVTLANNHMLNYGQAGLNNTKNHLSAHNIKYTGVNNYEIIEIQEVKFAFVGFNDFDQESKLITTTKESVVTNLLQNAKQNSDIVIAAFHWGNEYTSSPSDRQKFLARLAIDNGADIVIGHHPHWIQPIEIYKEKVIVYSHGNLIFDQMWSEKTRQGILSKFTFKSKKLINLEIIPIKIEDYGQPRILEGEEKQKIIDETKINTIQLL